MKKSLFKKRYECRNCGSAEIAEPYDLEGAFYCRKCKTYSSRVNYRYPYQNYVLAVCTVLLYLVILAGLVHTDAPKTMTPETWTPASLDASMHLFYMSPVSEAVSVNGAVVPAWDGDRTHQVDILECTQTDARISASVWIPRALLLADWCDARTFERIAEEKR